MFRQRKGAKRFSLLLLEEEEDYVQDWVVACKWPADVSGCWAGAGAVEGRIRLATRSLFFDPDDLKLPIVRLPFSSTDNLKAGGGPGASFTLTCTSATKMKANMEEAPYVFEKVQGANWVFTLLYAPLTAFLPVAQQLVAACKLPKPKRTEILEEFVRTREDKCTFDASRLADFSEHILLDVPAIQLTPLVRERGHLVVTNTRIYFQPMHNVSGDTPVRSHPLAGIAALARRRSCLRPLGLELFFVRPSDTRAARSANPSLSGRHKPAASSASLASEGLGVSGRKGSSTASLADLELLAGGQVWDKPSAFFAFRSEKDREAVITQLRACPDLGAAVPRASRDTETEDDSGGFSSQVQAHSHLLEAQGGWLYRVTAAWQQALISNFDYLMYLNLAAGRSFNDLAQYPVFPWVLSNWVSEQLNLNDPSVFRDLSKPVGALSPARLAEFKKRYEEMCEDNPFDESVPPFMYGTHYSTPGFVMYWLLRAAPAHMLRLQNGRFDAPDRLFHCMEESWVSCNTSSTDVKELIPEFYLPGGIWLLNAQRLALGVRQNGHHVADVILPPWAKDPEHFLCVHRSALEAPYVSQHLHQWIDLIFGYKQNGPAAVEANNVFYHLTYEGAVDVSKVTDPLELKALETQINEFGQTPRQLFKQPHPARTVIPPAPDPTTVFKELTTETVGGPLGVGPGASSASATNLMVVGGSETGHRALALALISAISTAATVEGLPEPPSSPAAPATTWTAALPEPPSATTLSPATSSQPPVTLTASRSSSGAAPSNGSQRPVAPSLLSSAALVSSAAGMVTTAGGMVSSAGGMLAGLLRMGRNSSPGIAPGSDPNAGTGPKSSNGTAASNRPVPTSPTASKAPAARDAVGSGGVLQRLGTGSSGDVLAAANKNAPAAVVPGAGTGAAATPTPTPAALATGNSSPSLSPSQQHLKTASAVSIQSSSLQGSVTAGSGQQEGPAAAGAGAVGQAVHSGGAGTVQHDAVDNQGDVLDELEDLRSILQLDPAIAPAMSTSPAGGPGSRAPRATERSPPTATPSKEPLSQQPAVAVSVPISWGPGVPDRLHACCRDGQGNARDGASSHCVTLNVSRDAITGVATWRQPGTSSRFIYCANSAGQLRVLHLDGPRANPSHSTIRLQQLDGELLCLLLLHTQASATLDQHVTSHPLILTGSHNRHVHAFSVERGQLQGSFQAHDDAVCAVAIPAPPPAQYTGSTGSHVGSVDVVPPRRFFTASWDCTIKAWSVGGGCEPWSWRSASLAPAPEASWDLEQGVWALTAGQEGTHLVVGGTEEGQVVACDVRASQPVWRASLAQDYIGGLALSPCSRYISVGAADGSLSLLDMRKAGAVVAAVQLDSPVRCCATDGSLTLAGVEAGLLHMWDVGLMSAARVKPVGRVAPAPDGQYKPWTPLGDQASTPAIAALAVSPYWASDNRVCADVVLGTEEGSVVMAEM